MPRRHIDQQVLDPVFGDRLQVRTDGVDVNPRKEPRHRLEYVPSLFHEYAKTLFGGELPLQEDRRIHDRQIGLNCRQSGFGDGLPGHLDFTSFLATILARMSASS